VSRGPVREARGSVTAVCLICRNPVLRHSRRRRLSCVMGGAIWQQCRTIERASLLRGDGSHHRSASGPCTRARRSMRLAHLMVQADQLTVHLAISPHGHAALPGTAGPRALSLFGTPHRPVDGPRRRRDLHDERRSEHYPKADAPGGRQNGGCRHPRPYHYQEAGLRCPWPGNITMSVLECSVTEQKGIRAAIPGQREVGDPCRVFGGDRRVARGPEL
jgi:hypothetical protein